MIAYLARYGHQQRSEVLGWTFCRRAPKPDAACCVVHMQIAELSAIVAAENGGGGDG